ncbi:MAG: arylsulfatase [Proteobacteria bacterium]|nr:arylsulfatase [Pseudomonadota bacterium]
MKRLVLTLACALVSATGFANAQTTAPPPAQRPNIVVVVVDDAGFMDFGAYGGEAHTPNIDALARRGAQFTHYYTSPLCAPSRAMLLTGVDNHRTGVATIPEVLPPEQQGHRGYTMHLEPNVLTVAQRLRAVGYRTYITGKWHLGHGAGDLPNDHGFDRSFVLDASGADNWQDAPYMPYNNYAPWFENGQPAHLPSDFYSSRFIVDRMIQYLDQDQHTAAPFFAYVAFQAVHIPVQAPREYTAHYLNTYTTGWDALREDRRRRAQALGFIPQGAPLAPMPHGLLRWSAQTPADQALYARSMAVYAGMLEAMDANLGRLIAYLQSHGLVENTIFVVTSDNGPEPSDPIHEVGFTQWMTVHGYTRRVDNLGEMHSYNFIGPQWASAAASPGDLFKFYAGDGGIHVPLIVAGPGVRAGRVDARAFVTDITPTLLQRAGAGAAPTNAVALTGVSMDGVLTGAAAQVRDASTPLGVEVSGNSALFRGDYKLVRNTPRFGDNVWRLYNIASDPGETHDLTHAQPQLFASMMADYRAYARANGVADMPSGYDPQHQTARNALMAQFRYYWWALLIAMLVLISALWFGVRLVGRTLRRG